MPKKIGSVDRSVLLNASLPSATKSYTVISHSQIINLILKTLGEHNFEVTAEEYRCNTGANVAHGTFVINYANDPELAMTYSFTNSYDKSTRFRSAVGAQILSNGAYMLSEMDHWKRKHTGTADDESEELIKNHISNAQKYYALLKEAKETMQGITISRSEFGQIIGELFLNGFLAIDQVSLIGREYEAPSFTYNTPKDNLWTCYNHVIHALHQSHPSKWMPNQIATHLFFVTKYNLVKFDEEPADVLEGVTEFLEEAVTGVVKEPPITGILDEVEVVPPLLPGYGPAPVEPVVIPEDVVDPAQVDLEESIAEIEKEQPIAEAIKEVSKGKAGRTWSKEKSEKLPVDSTQESGPDAPPLETAEAILPKEDDTSNAETIMVDVKDIPGVELNQVFDLGGEQYYTGLRFENVEGVDYMVCTPFDMTAEVPGPTPIEEPVEEPAILPVQEEPIVEVVPTQSEQKPVDVLEDTTHKEVSAIPEELTPPTLDPVHAVIGTELEEIYGTMPEFTYTLAGNQYNIVLGTGETITLSTSYIDGLLTKE